MAENINEIKTYVDRSCEIHLAKIIASAKKRELCIHWVLQSRTGQISKRPYIQKTIAAIKDGRAALLARCNSKGAVSWASISTNYAPSYTIAENISTEEVQP